MADKKSELKELSRMGATPTKNSGRGKFNKGDGLIGSHKLATVDVKEYNESFGLSRKAIAKLNKDSQQNQTRYGIFWIVLGEDEPRERWAAMPEKMFQELMELYEDTYGQD